MYIDWQEAESFTKNSIVTFEKVTRLNHSNNKYETKHVFIIIKYQKRSKWYMYIKNYTLSQTQSQVYIILRQVIQEISYLLYRVVFFIVEPLISIYIKPYRFQKLSNRLSKRYFFYVVENMFFNTNLIIIQCKTYSLKHHNTIYYIKEVAIIIYYNKNKS